MTVQISIPYFDHFVVYHEEGFEDVVVGGFSTGEDADVYIKSFGEAANNYYAIYRSSYDGELYRD